MLRNNMLAIISELNDLIAERKDSIECTAIGLLTKKNVFKYGDTGQAKSYEINEFRKRITGSKQFVYLLTKQTDETALFGHIDLKSLIDGNPTINTQNKIPKCHFVFLDELFKCNDGVLNSLLVALNERSYTNEGKTMEIDVISFLAASNEIPNFDNHDDQILRPLYDRFELKVVTDYIKSPAALLRVMLRKQRGTGEQKKAEITLEELYAMQREVAEVTVPEQISESVIDICCELRGRDIHVSDRKVINYHPIVQAKAWLSGRSIVQDTDLSVMKHYLWTKLEDIPIIQQVLDKFCLSPLQEEIKEITLLADESYKEFLKSIKDKPNSANKAIVKLRRELARIHRMLKDMRIETHDADGKTTLDNAIDELESINREAHIKVGFTPVPLSQL